MKVKELIEQLKNLSEEQRDLEVVVNDSEYGYTEILNVRKDKDFNYVDGQRTYTDVIVLD